MKNIFMVLMHKRLLLFCSLSISLFLFFSIMAGCSKPVVKMPSRLPPIVREYKHITFSAGPKQMKKTGVYLKAGDNFSILTEDILLRSSLIGMIGRDDWGFYISDIDNAYKPGDLYLGNIGARDVSFGVDIIVWKNEDYVQITDFLNKMKENDPKNNVITGLLSEINKRKEIYLVSKKASIEIEETKKKIKELKAEPKLKDVPALGNSAEKKEDSHKKQELAVGVGPRSV